MANVEHGGQMSGAFGAGTTQEAKARLKVARVGLWTVAAVLAVRQVAVVLGTPRGSG